MLRRTVLEAPCWTHISRGDAVLPPDPQAACARGNRTNAPFAIPRPFAGW